MVFLCKALTQCLTNIIVFRSCYCSSTQELCKVLQQLYMFQLCVLRLGKRQWLFFLNEITFFFPPPKFFSEVAGIWVKVLLKATFYNTGTKKKSSFKLVCTVLFFHWKWNSLPQVFLNSVLLSLGLALCLKTSLFITCYKCYICLQLGNAEFKVISQLVSKLRCTIPFL